MRKKFTLFFTLIALLFGIANAQVIFDPATYEADSLPAGMTLDTIDGTVYLQVITDGWSSWLDFYEDVMIAPGHSQFKTMAKYAVGASGEHVDTIGTYFKLLDTADATMVSDRQPSDTLFREYTIDGFADSAVVNQIQFAGQLQKGGWPALVGDTLWVGKIVAQKPNAFLDPLLVPADSLPADWTLDTIDGEVYFKVLLNGWSTYWEFHKDVGAYLVPEGVTAFKAMTKYSVGTSGFTVDNINTFIKFSDPSWAEQAASGQASDTVFWTHSQTIADSSILGVLQFAGQERTGWSAVVGDTLWVGVIEANIADSLKLLSEGGADTIDIDRDTLQLTAQWYPMDFPNSVTWSISNDSLATLTDGMVIAKGNGTVKVWIVSDNNSAFKDSIEITIINQLRRVDSIMISSAGDVMMIDTEGGTLQFSAMVYPDIADDTTFMWMVTPEGVATIDSAGLLTAVGDGMVTVTAMANDADSVVSNSIEVTVSNQVPVTAISVIGAGSVTEISDIAGTLQMFAAVLPEDASNSDVVWSVSDEGIATISAEGLLTAVTDGVVTVTATAADGSGITGTVDITISDQTKDVADITDQSLVVFPNPVINTLFIENAEAYSSFEILNMDGKLMMRVLNTGDRMSIDVSGLSNGMYILRGYQADQIHTIKLVK